MSPNIFIVDDEAPARNRLKTLLADIAAECPHRLAGEAGNAQAALDGIAATNPDLVLLDVQMPGMSGLELADHLRRLAVPPAVVFVTAYDEYAIRAFEVRALDYLLKPVRAARLADALRRVAEPGAGSLADRPSSVLQPVRRHFSVQERGRLLLVPVAEVVYLKAELKYVTVRTAGHEYLIEESLASLESEFAGSFVRVHRNALVARAAIAGFEKGGQAVDADGDRTQESWCVILRGIDERLPVSRRQWPVVKALVR